VCLAAIDYVDAGLSVIPVKSDGSKSPDWPRLPSVWCDNEQRFKRAWKPFQTRRPQLDELIDWYQGKEPFGLAIVAGAISGGLPGAGLEIIDFDTAELAAPWSKTVQERCPGLLERLVRVQSPRPGLHVYYRCPTFGASQKLALGPAVDENGVEIRNAKTN